MDVFDVWVVLQKNVTPEPEPPNPSDKPPKAERTWLDRAKSRVYWTANDVFGAIAWSYIFVKLFVYDIDTSVVHSIAPSYQWILGYKLLLVLGAISIVGIFLWRWWTIATLAYVVLFPAIVLVWKLPRFIAKRRSWLLVMVTLNSIALFARYMRFVIIAAGLGIAAIAIVFITSNGRVAFAAALFFALLLIWSVFRVISDTFTPSWFLQIQKNAIDKIVNSGFTTLLTTISEDIRTQGNAVILRPDQLANLTNAIQFRAVLSRALHFWAYRLHKYRQSQLALLFNLAAYALLFLQSWLTFSLLNIALLKIDPAQYQFASHPSNIAMLLYGLSTMVLNEGAGVAAHGDGAYLLRLIGGLYGILFLATVLINLVFLFRRRAEDEALEETVKDLRRRAREHEDAFVSEMSVTAEEAFRRLDDLKLAAFRFAFDYFDQAMPPGFLDPPGP